MTINPNVKIMRNFSVLSQQVSDQTILLSPRDGQYFALDDVGGRVWELCDGSRTISEIAVAIGNEYDAPIPVIEADLLTLFGDLMHEKLVDAC